MFTGIVQACGRVAAVRLGPGGVCLVVDRGSWEPGGGGGVGKRENHEFWDTLGQELREGRGYELTRGDSVSVSGVCLTVVGFEGVAMSFDVIRETLDRTTLGQLKPGDRVNLEAAVTSGTPLGGHVVQGHVDGVGEVSHVQEGGGQWRLTIRLQAGAVGSGGDLMGAIIPKGSITVDGVSLTVASVSEVSFEVALIPETLEKTTLGQMKRGDRVNIETDILSKTVVHWLNQRFGGRDRGTLTLDKLRDAGLTGGGSNTATTGGQSRLES